MVSIERFQLAQCEMHSLAKCEKGRNNVDWLRLDPEVASVMDICLSGKWQPATMLCVLSENCYTVA